MNRPRVLIDVDGPLTRGFFIRACSLLREEGIAYAHPDKIDRWDIFESFGVSKEAERVVRERLRRPGVAAGFLPNDGAATFLDELRTWADVIAVTSPLDGAETWTYDRELWLREELGFAPEQIVHARDKSMIGGAAFVDDKLMNVTAWAGEHPSGLAILWREPHNTADEWPWLSAKTYDDLRLRLDRIRPLVSER